MDVRAGRVVCSGYETRLAGLDRDAALASGLSTEEVALIDRAYSTGSGVTDTRGWYYWVRRFAAPQYLLAFTIGLPLLVILVLAMVSPGLANSAMPMIAGAPLVIALAWAANLTWSRLAPNVTRAIDEATTWHADPYWSRAVTAVAAVEQRLGTTAAARFDDALTQLHPEALRLAREAELRHRLGQDPAADPMLGDLLASVRSQVELITTEAVRLLSGEPQALESRPLEWQPAEPWPAEAELANEEELR